MTRREGWRGLGGLVALAAIGSGGGAAVAQTTAPDIPTASQGRGTPSAETVPGTTPNLRRGAGTMAAGRESEVMAAHGLGMAIEGYMLRCAAKDAGPAGGGGGGEAGDPAAMLRQHARSAFEASDRLLREASQMNGAREGGRGGAGGAPGEPGAAGEGAAAASSSARRTAGGGAGAAARAAGGQEVDGARVAPTTDATGGRGRGAGSTDAAGQGQAQGRGQEPGRAGGGQEGGQGLSGSAQARLLTAANAYAGTLRRLAPEAEDAPGGDAARKDEESRTRAEPGKEDKARIIALNHAVCELIDARMVLHLGQAGGSGTGSPMLARHAQQMRDEGLRTIRALAPRGGGDPARREGDGAAMPAPSFATLARHAGEFARAMDDLGGAADGQGAAGGPGREGGASGERPRTRNGDAEGPAPGGAGPGSGAAAPGSGSRPR